MASVFRKNANLDYIRSMFLKREKAFFVSRPISFYDNKYPKKKKHFYYKKKSWVAPFEKNAILCFYNMILLWAWKSCSLSRTCSNVILRPFLTKNNQ